MTSDILPLFSWSPPVQVIPFPTANRIGKVRHTAKLLHKKQGSAADSYWRQVCTGMARQMEQAGIPKGEVNQQMRDFFDAVQSELQRMSYRDSQLSDGDGAA